MMVKWENHGLLGFDLDNNCEMLINVGEMLVIDGEMSIWPFHHFTIID